MGKLEIKGVAKRKVDYDIMKIKIDFYAKAKTPDEASKNVMRECEDFLKKLKEAGANLSSIVLKDDKVEQEHYFDNSNREECYRANRELEIVTKFDMKEINGIRSIVNSMGSKFEFRVSYELSEKNVIMEELLVEALKDAKHQAEMLAAAIGQRVIQLISADKNEFHGREVQGSEIFCMSMGSLKKCEKEYSNSDELIADKITLSNEIYTVWEVDE